MSCVCVWPVFKSKLKGLFFSFVSSSLLSHSLSRRPSSSRLSACVSESELDWRDERLSLIYRPDYSRPSIAQGRGGGGGSIETIQSLATCKPFFSLSHSSLLFFSFFVFATVFIDFLRHASALYILTHTHTVTRAIYWRGRVNGQ